MLVSFIIPAYNAADTIVRCLESIHNLTLGKEDYEIIVIDDCSTDETVSIIGNWKLEIGDCKLEILQQPENHRQGAARNRGVKVAKGEYICFVDADDAVMEGIVNAIRLAKEMKADMVALHYGNANESGEITSEAQKLLFAEGISFTGIEMQNKHPYWCSAPWGYIYSKDFLQGVNYPFVEKVLYEDSDFVAVHLYHAKRMIYSQELGYKAYYREGSTTHHTSYKNVADYLLLGVRMNRFYKSIVNSEELIVNSEKQKFAEGILEGACWNVQKSCKRMIKLGSIEEVRAYYERIDAIVNRDDLCADKQLQRYYWNAWTSICIKHKRITMLLLAVLIPMYRMVKK